MDQGRKPGSEDIPLNLFFVGTSDMRKKPLLVVGLGNPGSSYHETRHNVGFIVADDLAQRYGARFASSRWKGDFAEAVDGRGRIFFLKPMTYMNRSGQSVAPLVAFFKMNIDQILVIHDDLDMAPGRVKLIRGGGAGGHNGIRSLIEHLGDKSFWRLKIGIGRPGQNGVHAGFPVDQYVLGRMDKDEFSLLQSRFDTFADGIEMGRLEGWEKAMNLLNVLR